MPFGHLNKSLSIWRVLAAKLLFLHDRKVIGFMFVTSLTLCRVSMSLSWSLKSSNVGLASGSFCQQLVMIWYLKLIYLYQDHHFMGDRRPGFWWRGLRRKQESKLTTYHPRVAVQAFCFPAEESLQFFFYPFVDKANRLKKNCL